jgi:hypothetical protein
MAEGTLVELRGAAMPIKSEAVGVYFALRSHFALLPMPPIRKPNAKWSLFADLEPSEPDNRPVGRSVDLPTLLMFNTL